jgi:Family of unknown function (DUF6496)
VPDKGTMERARKDAEEGKAASTQAGEFVREEMHHIREGKHGAASTKQAIAIGLSKARRAGVKLGKPTKGSVSEETRQKAEQDARKGRSQLRGKPSATRSRAVLKALKKKGGSAASAQSLSRQARSSARKRGASARHQAAMKAVKTKGKEGLREEARKAAVTRERQRAA